MSFAVPTVVSFFNASLIGVPYVPRSQRPDFSATPNINSAALWNVLSKNRFDKIFAPFNFYILHSSSVLLITNYPA